MARLKDADASRARAEAGIRECMTLITAGQWVPGASHQKLAEKYDVVPTTVKSWADQAARLIRMAAQMDPEDIRACIVAQLQTITSLALGRVHINPKNGQEHPAPDLKAAVAAMAEQAKLLGLVVQKHEVSAMTDEEADRLIAEAKKL